MEYYLIIPAILIAIGLWNLSIAILGLFPPFLSSAIGTLSTATTKQNVRTRYGSRIPRVTRYTYTYTVNGKEYRYRSEKMYSKRRLLPKISLVFVKWFPRHAYPNKFTGIQEWCLGLVMLLYGIFTVFSIVSTSVS